MVVHFAGLPCEMSDFKYLSKKYEFNIIEDASMQLDHFIITIQQVRQNIAI